jgi:hypothetical protein
MTFGSANDWVLGTGWSLAGGSLVYSGNSTSVASLPLSVLPVEAGQSFQIEIILSSLSGDTIYVGIGNAYCQLTTHSSTFSITAIAAKALEIQGGPGSTVSVDYIRVAAGGRDGKSVRYGTNDPVATDGTDGDFWINTTTHFIFGPKVSGAWPAGTSLVGPAGSGGGGLVLLEQHTASNSATLDFTSCISSAYDDYMIEVIDLLPTSAGASPKLQVSTDGGITYAASAYYWGQSNCGIGGSSGSNSGSNTQAIELWGDSTGTGQGSGPTNTMSGTFRLSNPLGAVTYKYLRGAGIGHYNGNNGWYEFSMGGFWEDTTAINALRFFYSSGNIASGTIRVYGIAK